MYWRSEKGFLKSDSNEFKSYLEVRVELIDEMRVRRSQDSVHHVHDQVLQPIEKILERYERALRLYVAVPVSRRVRLLISLILVWKYAVAVVDRFQPGCCRCGM